MQSLPSFYSEFQHTRGYIQLDKVSILKYIFCNPNNTVPDEKTINRIFLSISNRVWNLTDDMVWNVAALRGIITQRLVKK